MKRICVAALVALVVMTTGASANRGIFATWWDANDTHDHGLGLGIRSKGQISPLVSIDTRVSWIKFKDDDIDLFPLEATGMLRLGMLYAGAGMGYYIFNGANLKNSFGWYALGGIDIPAGRVGIFGEVKWNRLSTDVENVPKSVDAGGWAFNAGVMFGLSGK